MSRAILITGFNNWGKTTLIHALFSRKRYSYANVHDIPGVNTQFVVQSQSNDDLGSDAFTNQVSQRLSSHKPELPDLLCAFCPTRETWNDSRAILSGAPFSQYSEVYLLLLKYKWDMHAALRIHEITQHLSGIRNVNFRIINSVATGQVSEVTTQLKNIYNAPPSKI